MSPVVAIESYRSEDPKAKRFPFRPVNPREMSQEQTAMLWEKISAEVDLLCDATLRDPTPFFNDIMTGAIHLFSVGDWDGVLWIYHVTKGGAGTVNLMIWNPISLRRKVGPWKEAARDGLKWLMDIYKLNKLRGYIGTRNTRSWKLAKALGWKREGRLRQEALRDGRWRDVYAYGILREEL